jgi:hypothetical protein
MGGCGDGATANQESARLTGRKPDDRNPEMTFAITLITSAMLIAVYAVSILVDTSPHRDDDD